MNTISEINCLLQIIRSALVVCCSAICLVKKTFVKIFPDPPLDHLRLSKWI